MKDIKGRCSLSVAIVVHVYVAGAEFARGIPVTIKSVMRIIAETINYMHGALRGDISFPLIIDSFLIFFLRGYVSDVLV